MRIACPMCGSRDLREFYYQGAAVMLDRPAPDAGEAAWDAYLHLRENPAGDLEELWSHDAGCGAWLRVTRNVSTHEITGAALVREAKG
ncbi:MAG: sarcosine oxidase subunit delta [Pseudomonadota bacterium]